MVSLQVENAVHTIAVLAWALCFEKYADPNEPERQVRHGLVKCHSSRLKICSVSTGDLFCILKWCWLMPLYWVLLNCLFGWRNNRLIFLSVFAIHWSSHLHDWYRNVTPHFNPPLCIEYVPCSVLNLLQTDIILTSGPLGDVYHLVWFMSDWCLVCCVMYIIWSAYTSQKPWLSMNLPDVKEVSCLHVLRE